MDISIIILNYKSRGLTLSCIKSINEADFGNLKYEIIVVDNNSDDEIGKLISWQYPEIIFIQNDKNLGMGSGNNKGIKKSSGKYIAIMNPDTLAFPDTFRKLYDFMEADPEVGIAGPKQFYPDQSVQNTCFRWFGLFTPLYRRTPLGFLPWGKKDVRRMLMEDFDHNSVKEVDWLMGSFMFIRKSALEKVGAFDENFFMYFEDTDLCRRISLAGHKVIYFPEAKIIHNHLRESAQTPWYKAFYNKAAINHIVSWIKYLKKHGIKNTKLKNNK